MRYLPLLLLFFAPLALAQKGKEARETLRFIRLAETKKQLNLSEDKLLKLNDLLDVFEERRIELKQRERQLKGRFNRSPENDAAANTLLDEYLGIRQQTLDDELQMVKDVRALLTPQESIQFFKFYHQFQRDVQRRIRMLQQNRRNNRGGRQH